MQRRVLALMAGLGLLLMACGGSESEPVPTASAAPVTASEPLSTAADALAGSGSASTVPTATAVAEPTATPAPTPTSEPTAQPTATPEPSPTPVPALPSGCGAVAEPGSSARTFGSQGVTRTFWATVPAGYDENQPTAVVLNWHGFGSAGGRQLSFSDYESAANEHGFIVIAADGLPRAEDGGSSWDATRTEPNRDDLRFANELLDFVIDQFCVDENRVFSTGFSNGGAFTSHLVCEMSDRIAAAVSVAAVFHADDCQPTRPVPYLAFHGTLDRVVAFGDRGFAEFAEFAEGAGCALDPVATDLSDNVTEYAYVDCAVEMSFFGVAGAGHTWPGSTQSLATSESAGLGATTDEISATDISWQFFARHSIDG